MAESLMQDQQSARQKRQYIARSSNTLLDLAEGDASNLEGVTWHNLQTLPAWCLLDIEDIRKLQLACGAVQLQPLFKSCVDGSVLKKLKEIVGETIFHFLLESDDARMVDEISTVTLSSDDSLEMTINSVGSSVLLGTLADRDIVKLFIPALGKPALVLKTDQSADSYRLACQCLNLALPANVKPAVEQNQNSTSVAATAR